MNIFQIKKTKAVSVLPVGFSGGLKYEGPICHNGTAARWRAHYAPERYNSIINDTEWNSTLILKQTLLVYIIILDPDDRRTTTLVDTPFQLISAFFHVSLVF